MLEFIFGPANSGKSQIVYRRIAEALQRRAASVVLLVPEQNSFESERAILKYVGSRASQRVEVLTFSRLAELVTRQVGGAPGLPLDDGGRLIFMGQALEKARPALRYYAGQADRQAFIRAALDMIGELKQCGLTPDGLLALANDLPEGTLRAKVEDFSRMMGEYDALVASRNMDKDDLLTRLYDALAECSFFEGKQVFFDAFFGFTGQQWKVIDRIFQQSDALCFALPADAAEDKAQGLGIFSNIHKTAARLRRMAAANGVRTAAPLVLPHAFFEDPALTALESGFRQTGAPYEEETDALTVVSAGNLYEEVDFAARTIHRMVRTTPGLRYRDFVLIARDMHSYQNAVETVFARYDIPVFIDEQREAASMPVLVYALAAFRAAHRFATEDILCMLKTGLSSLSAEEVGMLEDYAYIWNLNGAEDWLSPWTGSPDGFTDGDRPEDFADRLEELNCLRAAVTAPLEKLQAALLSGQPRKMAAGLYTLLCSTGVDRRLKAWCGRLTDEGEGETADCFRQSYRLLLGMLSQLAAGLGEETTPARFYALFELVVSSAKLGVIPQKLDTVTAGSAEKIRPARPRFTFLLGFNAGAFPRLSLGGLLSSRERTALGSLGLEIRDCHLASSVEESYLLYRTLFSCYSRLFISYVRATPSGAPALPAAALGRITDLLPGCRRLRCETTASLNPEELETAAAAFPRLAARWGEQSAAVSALRRCYAARPEEAGRLNALALAAREEQPTLSGQTAGRLFGKNLVLSASRIDTFARCRFSYFCRYGLKVRPPRRAELDVMQRGTAVHYVLESLIKTYGERLPGVPAPEREAAVRRALEAYVDRMLCGARPEGYRLSFMLERLYVVLCDLAARLAEELAVSDFTPAYCELKIGFDEACETPPLRVKLQEGTAAVVGSIDRLDTLPSGGRLIFRIVDYKTGSKKFELPDIVYGLNMQMLVYLCAVRRGGIRGEEEPLSPAGILYMPAKRAIAAGEDKLDAAAKTTRMNGLLSEEETTLVAMNREKDGRFVPVAFNKNGSLRKSRSLIPPEEFSAIEAHILRYIRQMGDALHAGDISINPLDGISSDACAFCDYAAVCRRAAQPHGKVPSRTNEEIFELLRKEEEQNALFAD